MKKILTRSWASGGPLALSSSSSESSSPDESADPRSLSVKPQIIYLSLLKNDQIYEHARDLQITIYSFSFFVLKNNIKHILWPPVSLGVAPDCLLAAVNVS